MNIRSKQVQLLGKRLWLLLALAVMLGVLAPQSAQGAPDDESRVLPGFLVEVRASDLDAGTRIAPPANVQQGGTATINVTYNGFTPEAQAAFQYAVDIWEAQLVSTVPIEVVANWTALPAGVLGSAGPTSFQRDWTSGVPAPRANTWYPIPLANKLAGVDLATTGTSHDINANFSSAFPNWYFGTDGNTPAGDFDFVSVVLHELGHGLGFVGSGTVSAGNGSWGSGTGFPFIYDVYVENGAGTDITDTGSFPNNSTILADQLQGGDLFFNSPTAVVANGGTRPELFAPNPWQQGSSYSHLDETVFPAGNPNSLMTPQIGTAEAIHNPGAITRGMFTDMGWTTVAPTAVTLGDYTATSNSAPVGLLAVGALFSAALAALWRRKRG